MKNYLLESQIKGYFHHFNREALYKLIKSLYPELTDNHNVIIYVSDKFNSIDIDDYKLKEVSFGYMRTHIDVNDYDDRFVLFHINSAKVMQRIAPENEVTRRYDVFPNWLLIIPQEIEILVKLTDSFNLSFDVLYIVYQKVVQACRRKNQMSLLSLEQAQIEVERFANADLVEP